MKIQKMKFICFISFLLLLGACTKKKTIKLEINVIEDSASLKKEKRNILITFSEANATKISYKNAAAIAYAKKYSGLNDNSCGIYNNNASASLSDCAHFISHCLKDGGIEIKAAQPDYAICKDGLCYRVVDLTEALKKLSQSYSNVQQIGIEDAIIGDYGFFKIPVVRPTHAFMICQAAANTDDITIYAHTTNRNCTKPEPKWYQFFGEAFRITDAN